MVDIKLPKLIDINKVDKAIQKALETTYIRELIIRTPKKTGFTASQWSSIALGNFNYIITNPEGDTITFLEEGTKAHTILPKTKKMLKFEIEKPPTLRSPEEQKQFSKKNVIFFFNKRKQAVLGFSKEGGKYYCYARKVRHPGFEGKRFVRNILQDESLFRKFEQQIIKFI